MSKAPELSDFYAIPEGSIATMLSSEVKRGGAWESAVFEAPFVIDDRDGAFHPLLACFETGGPGYMKDRTFRAAFALPQTRRKRALDKR